ncbi:hypothetical protein [Hymenobacter sp. 5414T-23]|uniref:hypothetical protein n=1 Tax=Hymenobacter sp. 5414T-23 TaxID=2932252 RepID=UPI001FD5A754|nr:hypothetical protein [Hymenobacter sp. 5414T-23]UOQ81006.1 hypothetical protein MUN83_19700 [Hymenobacter sp. 5414T-23]
MLTPLQFSQLVSAAWSGPAVAHYATISHYVAPSGYQVTHYQVSYHPSPGTCHYAQQECPFLAVAAAVATAAAAGVPVSRCHAQHIISLTAASLCGVQLLRPGFACRARRHRVARLHHA